eukprot:TRINITY_DN2849_c0_g1_i1.p4 TRINITY_DN2849_c0_g1~~TRINITY_DN2849_c0_g1_i1.p4  ORF type:complete len:196 (-),score=55.08 TRINITY_DN2849_c0_g1_i1:3854-4441(-)
MEENNRNAKRRIAMKNRRRLKKMATELEFIKKVVWDLQMRLQRVEIQSRISTLEKNMENLAHKRKNDTEETDSSDLDEEYPDIGKVLEIAEKHRKERAQQVERIENQPEEKKEENPPEEKKKENPPEIKKDENPPEKKEEKPPIKKYAENSPVESTQWQEEKEEWFENYPFSIILPGPWSKEFVGKVLHVVQGIT